MRVDYLFTESASRRVDRDAWFKPDSLARLVPDVLERFVYICGPEGMTSKAIDSLRQLGVPSRQIRTEVFRL